MEIDFSHQDGIANFEQFDPELDLPPYLTKLDVSYIWKPYYHTPFTLTIRSDHSPTNLEYLNFRSNFVTDLKKFNLEKPNSSIPVQSGFLS